MGGRRERSGFHVVVVERGRERERWVEGVVAVLNVSTLINFTRSANFLLIINCKISLENINMPEEFLNSYCQVLQPGC